MQDMRAAGLRLIGLEDPFTIRGRAAEWMMTVSPAAINTAPLAGVPTQDPGGRPAEPDSSDWRDPALRISVDEFIKLSAGVGATLIDVRDQGMFAKGHIPNAVHIPLEDIKASADRLRVMKRPLVTYCS